MDNNEQNLSLDELETLLIEGEQIRKEKIAIKHNTWKEEHKEEIVAKHKIYYEAHKDELLAKQKIYKKIHKEELNIKKKTYNEQKAQELGFKDSAQRRRYNRWCKKNNIRPILENPEYLEKIQYWINNIDTKRS